MAAIPKTAKGLVSRPGFGQNDSHLRLPDATEVYHGLKP